MWSVGDVVVPGDIVCNLKSSEKTGKTVIGPGLHRDAESIVVTKPGVLRHREPNFYWVDSHQKRYVATRNEHVVGIVSSKGGDVFKVDIGGSEQASLSYLAFDGATKKNRPDVKIGDVVYGKLLAANKDMEPEMVCIDSVGRSSGMGVIRDGGFLFHCSLNLVRKILSSECVVLKAIANHLPYEIAIGMNGRMWLKGRSAQETITIANTICGAEYMANDQIKLLVRRSMDALTGLSS